MKIDLVKFLSFLFVWPCAKLKDKSTRNEAFYS